MFFKKMGGPAALLIGWALGCAGWTGAARGAMFAAGDLAVVRVGDGSAALSSAATAVFLDEYTITGRLVQSIALPTTGAGAFTNSGSATSEGALSLSSDGRYLALAGYNTAVGTASVVGTTSAAVAREVAVVGASGTANTSTQFTSAFSGNNIRGAVVVSNSAGQPGTIYAVGSNGGVQATTYGSTATPTMISSSSSATNLRVVNLFNGQLYVSSASGAAIGINTVGTGTPTATGQPLTLVAPDTTGTSPSPYGFVFLGSNLYVADSNASTLLKYTSNGSGGYALVSETYTGATLTGLSGLTGSLVNGVATLYGTRTSGSTSQLLGFVDNGATINGTVLATAGANTAFRGVAFAPTTAPSAVPEPASIVLVGLGLAGATLAARRRA